MKRQNTTICGWPPHTAGRLFGVGLISAVTCSLGGPASSAPVFADLVITGARIYTADADRSIADALAIRDGRIVYVGGETHAKDWVGPLTRVEHEGGRLVLPGLIDLAYPSEHDCGRGCVRLEIPREVAAATFRVCARLH